MKTITFGVTRTVTVASRATAATVRLGSEQADDEEGPAVVADVVKEEVGVRYG